ncbi:hypothetical protein D5W64_12560 [Salmonella enterica subsp. enterica serovar Saintpaul]|nr:hypothetical protein [Salmonella enterica subsp. enterica serovar Saintpaul]
MKYVSSLIYLKNEDGCAIAIDVNQIRNFQGTDNGTRVFMAGVEPLIEIGMKYNKFCDLVEQKRREIWEAQHAVDELKISLLAEIRDNTKSIECDPIELVNQMREQFLTGGLYGAESSKPYTESNS